MFTRPKPIGGWVNTGCNLQVEALMRNLVTRFIMNDSGATAIEYGLIAAGIAVAIIATVNLLGGKLNDTFAAVNNQITP